MVTFLFLFLATDFGSLGREVGADNYVVQNVSFFFLSARLLLFISQSTYLVVTVIFILSHFYKCILESSVGCLSGLDFSKKWGGVAPENDS